MIKFNIRLFLEKIYMHINVHKFARSALPCVKRAEIYKELEFLNTHEEKLILYGTSAVEM